MRVMILALLLTAACGDDRCQGPTVETYPGVCHVPNAGAPEPVAGSPVREPFVIVDRDAGTRVVDADSGEPEHEESGRGGSSSGEQAGLGGVGGGNPIGSTGGAGAGQSGLPAGGSMAGAGDVRGGSGGSGLVLVAGSYSPPPKPVCGNGIVETDETCDGNCPSCDDGDPCTVDSMAGSKFTCDVKCDHKPITAAITGDMCCPKEARASADGDCVCRGDYDCGADEYCSGARCRLLACAGDGDCADDRWCTSGGQCGLRRAGLCMRDRTCPAGQTCKPGSSGFNECAQ